LLPVLAGLLIFTAVAAGAYPALIVSAFPPLESLQGRLSSSGSAHLRRTLIVIQFSLSVFLIATTGVVYKQLAFLQSLDVGYNHDRLVAVSMAGGTRNQYPVLKEELLKNPDIVAVSGMANALPFFGWSTDHVDWPGKDPTLDLMTYFNVADHDFIDTTEIRIVEGRGFDRDRSTDSSSGVLVNQTMARILELEPAVGATFTLWEDQREVIGVVEDFHFQPLQNTIGPLVLMLDPEQVNDMLVLVRSGGEAAAIQAIRQTFERLAPMFPPAYTFVGDRLLDSHGDLRKMGALASGFTVLTILIACLGVVGLSSFAAERRTKEIGIRKVLGASAVGIVGMMTRELFLLLLLAIAIAWPVAYHFMGRWLEAYAYRVEMGWAPFVLAGFLALAVTILTALPLTARAATRNPVETLRYE
jgi:hypothetical protein